MPPPGVRMRVTVLNEAEFRDALDERHVLEPVEDVIREAALFAEKRVRERSFETRDTSALARSWTSEVHGLTAEVFSPLQYAIVEEEGRRPGAKMPPPAALEGWARRHGFPTDRGALFVLARAIGRRGRKGRFHLRGATADLERRLPSMLGSAARNIIASIRSSGRGR